MPVAINFR